MNISEEEYKLAKEAHVANCTGGTMQEVNMVCASLVSSHMLWNSLVHSKRISPDTFIPQFLIYIMPVLLCLTVAADYASYITIGMATCSFLFPSTPGDKTKDEEKDKKKEEYKPYLTVYRAGTMILTCIAILAVDFQSFPRRFAKVETFGTSLMDIGVGSFVFSSGVVASRGYTVNSNKVQKPQTLLQSMLKSIRSAFPILVLGFARLFMTKSVNYQEHNSEYGLHWNFFFTLGFLPPFATLLGFCRKIAPFSVLALIVASVYQFTLSHGLQNWILNAPRTDLISANKEGICSFAGYLSIFLFGLECGSTIFQTDISNSALSRLFRISDKKDNKQVAVHLFTFSFFMWAMLVTWVYCFPEYYVSRRMANLPYIFWVIGFNLLLLSSLVLVESMNGIAGRGPALLDAININGLFTFLLANILTGTINLSMRTLYATDLTSSIVNTLYMLFVTLIPWVMWRQFHLRVKF